MAKSTPLQLLIQGGLGNQLLQWVLAETLAKQRQRELRIDNTLMRSWSRAQRGLSQRQISPLLGPADKGWHHWQDIPPRRKRKAAAGIGKG